MKKQLNQWLIIGSILVAACSQHTRPPTDLISQTDALLKEVETPETMAKAPLEVKQARENLDKAKGEMSKKEFGDARRYAEKAMVQAKLAQAKTQAEKSKEVAKESEKSIEVLKEETQRKINN